MPHTFHIPVLGLAYSIDTPVKVARFGISSVVSIVQDELLEQMRKLHSIKNNFPYQPILNTSFDYRANRVTAYLNMLMEVINQQMTKLKQEPFQPGTEITKYFTLLPDTSKLKKLYLRMINSEGVEQAELQIDLRNKMEAGRIDVNIMTKLDHNDYKLDTNGMDSTLFSDAMSALRGYAMSELHSSIIFSAGLNPKLYSYLETFPDFFPDVNQEIQKRVIIKVSDYRSALIQGRFLAKKGIWVSEFRIESGLNCGGHAFPTEGYLLGPVLEEFKQKRVELESELKTTVNESLSQKNRHPLNEKEQIRVSVQGGIGTGAEDAFLRNHYGIDATGWGSPFLLVPEATNVDDLTLNNLAEARQEDYYLSGASPLGVPFNNFRKSSSEIQRKTRIGQGKPGSPCFRKHLSFNTEFTNKPICTASRKYQHHKLRELNEMQLPDDILKQRVSEITEKDCLCEGLSAAAYLVNKQPAPHQMEAVSICPGPNLAYFSGVFSLQEMIEHIYGKINLLNKINRPHMFLNELKMYINYLQTKLTENNHIKSEKQMKYLHAFKSNLLSGIKYYLELEPLQVYEQELLNFYDTLQQTSIETNSFVIKQ